MQGYLINLSFCKHRASGLWELQGATPRNSGLYPDVLGWGRQSAGKHAACQTRKKSKEKEVNLPARPDYYTRREGSFEKVTF